jgi:pyridoxine 4-dehydrogenase
VPADIARARRTVPIVSVQNHYDLTGREWEAEVDYAERERLAFIPWFPLSAGGLDEGGQIALAWLLARSGAVLVIPGTFSVSHLEENVGAAEIALTHEDMNDLSA